MSYDDDAVEVLGRWISWARHCWIPAFVRQVSVVPIALALLNLGDHRPTIPPGRGPQVRPDG